MKCSELYFIETLIFNISAAKCHFEYKKMGKKEIKIVFISVSQVLLAVNEKLKFGLVSF